MDLRVLDSPQCDPKRYHRKDEGNKNKERPGARRNHQRMSGRARGSRESVKGSHRAAAVGAPSGLFCNDTASTEIFTPSLHDALPICQDQQEETERTEV